MTGWAAGLALPLAAALMLVWRVAPRGSRLPLLVPVIGIAVGVASAAGFTLLAAGIHAPTLFLTLDAAIWLTGAGCTLALRRSAASNPAGRDVAPRDPPSAVVVGLLLSGALAIAASWFVATSSVYPHGEWDAWAQWNLRARFFFRGFEDGTWRNAFAPVLAWSHPDYPMLLPMSIARLWVYGGSETVLAPIAFSGLMAAGTVAAAALGIAHTRGATRGGLAAAALLACPSLVRYSAAQCADVALGFFLLCAFILWARAEERPGTPLLWMLAGAAAALAAWTKNEGLAAFGIVAAAVAAERWWSTRSLRDAGWLLAGAAPVLLVVLAFKLALAPPSYFTSEQSLAQAAASLTDAGRIRLVVSAFGRELWTTGASTIGVLPVLALFVLVRGVDVRASAVAHVAIAAMMLLLVVYAAAYLVTPKDLAWQLRTSLDRLILQVVPTLTWATVTLCR